MNWTVWPWLKHRFYIVVAWTRLSLEVLWSNIRPHFSSKSPCSSLFIGKCFVGIILTWRSLKQFLFLKSQVNSLRLSAHTPCWIFFQRFRGLVCSRTRLTWSFFHFRSIGNDRRHSFFAAFVSDPFFCLVSTRSRNTWCRSHLVAYGATKSISRWTRLEWFKILGIITWSWLSSTVLKIREWSSTSCSYLRSWASIVKYWTVYSWSYTERVWVFEF
jgi:hypothetical protein